MATQYTTWIEQAAEDGSQIVYMQGCWRLTNLADISAQAERLRQLEPGIRVIVDGSRLEHLDTATGFALWRALQTGGIDRAAVGMRAMQGRHARLLELIRERMLEPAPGNGPTRRGLVPRIGASVSNVLGLLLAHNAFIGSVTLELLTLLRRPRLFRLKETVSQFETVTIDAIPIVVLVTFLIGVVFAYLLGVQAQRFGASIFVVDGVGLAICRELSPILVAVIVAGRSGAAFTAQISSMKVQEEIDAIQTLGLSPIQVLVVPRLVAIVLGLPLLVFVGDAAGIAGGVLVAGWQLGISPGSFIGRLHSVLPISAFVVGVVKAPVFAAFIALIACRMGLSASRDARSVGEHTTSTVVQSIVWVIVLDAAFAVTLQILGI